jgi:hypothetical protein
MRLAWFDMLATPPEPTQAVSFLGEQLIVLFTIVGAVAALPALIEFWLDRRKRRERVALSLDDLPVSDLKPHTAGFGPLFDDIADLVDRAARPADYAGLNTGNELLVLGSSLSGKKMFAQELARRAKLDRLIVVWNPRNADALAAAKNLIRSYRRQKVMLLLPRIDSVYEQEDDELLSELSALIETTSELANVLVVGTATRFEPGTELDNTFGIKLVLPGTPRELRPHKPLSAEARHLLRAVIDHHWTRAQRNGFRLEGLHLGQLMDRLLEVVSNPAEVEDIIALCQTAALHRMTSGATRERVVDAAMIERAISHVGIDLVIGDDDQA